MIEQKMMAKAVEISKLGGRNVFPNPMVGAVIFDDNGNIHSEGWHKEYGKDHAEIVALKNLKTSAKGLNMAVSLEPCNHFGKTPPCSHAIVKAGIKKVFIATKDFGKKAGGGAEYLKKHGVEVEFLPKFAPQVKKINKFFFKTLETSMPFVALKMAKTLDGFISLKKGKQTAITSEESLKEVHLLRALFMSVGIGANTLNVDNPLLTVRLTSGTNPLPVIFSKNLTINCEKKIFDKDVLVFTSVYQDKIPKCFANKKVIFETIMNEQNSFLKSALELLWKKYKINSILIEGGAKLASSFIKQLLVDEYHDFTAPFFAGEGVSAFDFGKMTKISKNLLKLEKVKQSGTDIYAVFSKKS